MRWILVYLVASILFHLLKLYSKLIILYLILTLFYLLTLLIYIYFNVSTSLKTMLVPISLFLQNYSRIIYMQLETWDCYFLLAIYRVMYNAVQSKSTSPFGTIRIFIHPNTTFDPYLIVSLIFVSKYTKYTNETESECGRMKGNRESL